MTQRDRAATSSSRIDDPRARARRDRAAHAPGHVRGGAPRGAPRAGRGACCRARATDPRADPDAVTEARAQLLQQTRRADDDAGARSRCSQGKQRALQRYRERLDADRCRRSASAPAAPTAGRECARSWRRRSDGRQRTSRDVLAAQEEMRREIARQMHDGPAQSIANIALQAQVVQRLFERDPTQAEAELRELVTMVEQRARGDQGRSSSTSGPMVLDDLGLVPTLRRVGRRAEPAHGRDRSLRIGRRRPASGHGARERPVPHRRRRGDRAICDGTPAELVVRLDWSESGLQRDRARTRPVARARPSEARHGRRCRGAARQADARRPGVDDPRAGDARRRAAAGLPDAAWAEIEQPRRRRLGIARRARPRTAGCSRRQVG